MKFVQTVCGPVAVEKIGFALMHEHVMASGAGIQENYPQFYRPDHMELLLRDLKRLKENQIDTIVDASLFDLGRDPKRVQKASEVTGVNIIQSTGFFFEISPTLGTWNEKEIAQMFVDDLTKGMAGTDIKAGMIKAVMDMEGPTPGRRLLHHAAGIASNETGVPVYMHTNPLFETARYQIALLKEVGVPVYRMKLDHILETTNMDYIKWVYDQGVWIGAERMPRVTTPNDPYAVYADTRIKTFKAMIDAGMADRMLIGHDFSSVTPVFDRLTTDERRSFDAQIPGRWLYYKNVVFPKLVEMGVDEDILIKIAQDNPRRFFEGC